MAETTYNVFEIDSDNLSRFRYFPDEKLTDIITPVVTPRTFTANQDFIELSYFTLDNVRLQTIQNYSNYSILSGDTLNNTSGNSEISIDPVEDYKGYYGNTTPVKALYNFLTDPYRSNGQNQSFYIESISADRQEVRLIARALGSIDVERKTNTLVNRFEDSRYSVDLHLYTAPNSFYSCINISTQPFRRTTAVLLKFAEPLPILIQTNDIVSIVERISDSVAFEINPIIIPAAPIIPTLRSANFNVEIEEQVTEPSQYFNYNELFSFPTTNTYRELNSLFNEKGAEVSVDYSDFSNFINFSSAEERLRNFEYKLQLIESYQTSLDSINSNLPTYTGTGITGSRDYFENLINGVLNNFDHYERHLFYESGSTSWPKSNSVRPYVNVGTTTGAGIDWFNAEISDAILYDAQNSDLLTNTVPAYLKEDTDNRPYELFIHMIAQHFDNLWLYTNAVSKKYDNDNRLNRGVSKDLVEDLLKNFGVKLYTSNRSAQDLFRYFTANSYELDDFEPNLDPIIKASDNPVSQNDYQKEIYKRIYHNLPLLMKSKGTERGLRALINCFGIPSDVLKIRIYGGQSSEDLPFFGGQQAFTGSIDKVRLNNIGSIVEGDTVSQHTSIIKLDNFFTQDLHNIEVGFSPTHNIDTYILSQSAVLFPDNPFDIDDYIGDPREISTNSYFYLRDYADTIFAGVDSYDLKDFVRFIKFFDNVIFRMVRDFIPARTVADTGIIIKPHLLERSKYEAPVMSWTQPEYTGSINTAFISGSSGGVYESFATGSVSGSLITSYINFVQTPIGIRPHSSSFSNRSVSYVRNHEEARFDGELYGSEIRVSDGELNRDNEYKTLDYSLIKYDVRFYKDIPADACIIGSLGQGGNPYIIRPTEDPYDLSSLFSNGNLQEFDYTVDGEPIANPSSVTLFGRTWTQYESVLVNATKTTNASCTATTFCRKVDCTAEVTPGTIPEEFVYTDRTYNLNTWFTRNDNVQSSIYVNNVLVDPENYQFQGNEGDLVDVKLQDDIDPTCQVIRTFIIRECSLEFNPNYLGFSSTSSYLNLNNEVVNPSNIERSYYNVATAFNGVISNQGAANTIFNVIFFFEKGLEDGSIGQFSYGPTRINTYTSAGVPLLESLNPNAEPASEGPLEILAETYPAFYNILDSNNILEENITGVELIARTPNPGGITCTATTPRIPIPGPLSGAGGGQWRTVNPGGQLKFSPRTPTGGYLGECELLDSIPQTIYYILPPGGQAGPTAILNNGYSIYTTNSADPQYFAPAGKYAVWFDSTFDIPDGVRVYRSWDGQTWISEPEEC